MKTFIILASVSAATLFIVCALAITILFASQFTSVQEPALLQAIADNDPDSFYAQLAPAVADELDQPLLKPWIQQFNQKYGEFQGTSASNFSSKVEWNTAGSSYKKSGIAMFKNGQSKYEIVEVDGKVSSFEFEAKLMNNKWLTEVPKDTDFYDQKAKAFVTTLDLGTPEELHQLMHPALREQISLEQLAPAKQEIRKTIGKFQDIRIVDRSLDIDNQKLKLKIEIQAETGTGSGFVTFQRVGMKMEILGFDVHADLPAESAAATK